MSPGTTPLNLAACENEPIRVPGSIQPHGVLLAADAGTLVVHQASENAGTVFNVNAVIGRSVRELLGESLHEQLRKKLPALERAAWPTRIGTWSATTLGYDLIAHRHDTTLLLELEALTEAADQVEDLPNQVLDFVAAIEEASGFEALCQLVSRQVRRLIGFDRVLVYRFDEAWNGTVVGEDRNERLPSYFDLRFPASDIPAQARDLYRLNRSRIIPNVDYRPVPIAPAINPHTRLPLDLSLSTLRSVSPIHLEYMRNMGTPASTSFSILRNGQLWGLIACHNSEPRMVPFSVRRACELIAQTFALQVASLASREDAESRVRLNETRSQLLASMTAATNFADALAERGDELLAFADAGGVAIVTPDALHTAGKTPSQDDIRAIANWLSQSKPEEVFHTSHLSEHFPDAARLFETASGLLALSISRFHKTFLLWFRPEVARTVTWAGDPNKAKSAGPHEGQLHPRVSFEAWKETVRGRSQPWTDAELAAAAAMRNDIVAIVLRKAEALAAVSQELERTNKELEAFSYSVSHDLRAPFRHIVGYSELVNDLEAARLSERGKRYVQTVIEAGRTAGRLIDNLLLFSQMGRNGLSCMKIDMRRMFEEVRTEVVAADAASRKIEWTLGTLPAAWADPNMIRLVVRNLVSNAVKYTRGRDVARIEITGTETEDLCRYVVKDNGVGFDMTYIDKLFGVFQRLHRIEEFEGTGIGLANVRRIVGRHGGTAWAEGRVGEGATFYFELPRQPIAPTAVESSVQSVIQSAAKPQTVGRGN